MAILRPGVIVLTAFCFLASANAQQPSMEKHVPALDVTSMDRSIDPCVDFFAYSCGGWIKNNPIPPDQSSWDTYSKMEDGNKDRLRGILEAALIFAGVCASREGRIAAMRHKCLDPAGTCTRDET